ncbi:17433_t:CDS:2 [Funneliformis geosporum]|nr:17433_t:CDS:2 [Funneliformis geosporum]
MTDRLVICIDKLNNKLKDLLEENKRLKQQHENLQEENRETLHINSEQKEMLQERDKQFEKLIIYASWLGWNLEQNTLVFLIAMLNPKCFPALAKTSSRKSGIVDYKKAITDYLGEIGKNHIIFFENVLLIISCPAKYSDKTKVIMRECAFNAGLINDNNSITLQFISGGLIICKLINENRVEVITERSDTCGKFSHHCKFTFMGEHNYFENYELDIDEISIIKQYITEDTRTHLDTCDWLIELDIDDIKLIFDLCIEKVIHFINTELNSFRENCSTMCLIGSFSESKYLQNRIKKEFQSRINFLIPGSLTTVAIAYDAIMHGFNLCYIDVC